MKQKKESIQVCIRMRPILTPYEDEVAWTGDPENNTISTVK
jgi:hypothetical protein